MKTNFQKLHSLLLDEKPEKADVVVWLQGDRYDRGKKILEIYKAKYAELIVISGNNILIGPKTRFGENNIGLPEMRNFLIKGGINKKNIIVDDGALNTKNQSTNIIKLAKKNAWKKIILVSSSYHQPRAFLSILKAIQIVGYDCKIINQSYYVKNNMTVSGRKVNTSELIKNEISKINKYQLKGDISSYEEGFDYIDRQSVEQNTEFKFRLATIDDAVLLLRWRNDNETRKSSVHGEKIIMKKHIQWLEKLFQNGNRNIYIVEREGFPVGTIRTDNTNGIVELSWTVAPEARGKGIGKKMVLVFANQLKGLIKAKIKFNNTASIHIAKYIGMRQYYVRKGILYFSRLCSRRQSNKK